MTTQTMTTMISTLIPMTLTILTMNSIPKMKDFDSEDEDEDGSDDEDDEDSEDESDEESDEDSDEDDSEEEENLNQMPNP